MASMYRTHHSIPEGFPQILKDFTREILRAQPESIYDFGAQYFRDKIMEQQSGTGVAGMSADEIEQYLYQIFHANTDGSGTLSRHDFKKLLDSADLGLSKKQIKMLYSEADENDDGVINYSEFITGAVTLLQAMSARDAAREAMYEAEAEAEELAQQHLIHGLTEDEVQHALQDAWFEADRDGSGFLDKKEIQSFLKSLPLNLTRKERNIIMGEIDFDEDGNISREQFIPLAHAVMLEVVKQEFFHVNIRGTELEQMLFQLFRAHASDEEQAFISVSDTRRCLKDADFGLTKFQLFTIVSEAPITGKQVNIDAFVPVAARMIEQMVAPSAQEAALRQQALASMQDEGMTVAGMGLGELEEKLMEFFRSYDGDASGYLEATEFQQAITSGTEGTGIDFTPEQAQLLLVAADEDGDGRISYNEFMRVAIQLLEYHDREQRIREYNAQQE